MSTIQKILLACSSVLFAATVYCLFLNDIYLIVFFFLMHSLCLIFFSYRTYTDIAKSEHLAETYHQDIGMEIAAKNKELGSLKEELDLREKKINDLYGNIAELNDKCSGYEGEIESLNREKAELKESAESMKNNSNTDFGALLPPVPDEEHTETVNIIEIAEADPAKGDRIMCVGNPQNEWFAVHSQS